MHARVLIGGNDDYHDLVGAGTRLRDILAGAGMSAVLRVGCGEQQLGGPETVDREHPVTAGVGDFEIEDELYLTAPVGEPVETLASALHEGKRHPMATVREAGRGRVCFIALGHDERAQSHPAFRRLVTQAARWAGRKGEAPSL